MGFFLLKYLIASAVSLYVIARLTNLHPDKMNSPWLGVATGVLALFLMYLFGIVAGVAGVAGVITCGVSRYIFHSCQ